MNMVTVYVKEDQRHMHAERYEESQTHGGHRDGCKENHKDRNNVEMRKHRTNTET